MSSDTPGPQALASRDSDDKDVTQRCTRPPSYYPHVNQTSSTNMAPHQQIMPGPSGPSTSAVSVHTGSAHRAPSDDRNSASASCSVLNVGGIQEPRYSEDIYILARLTMTNHKSQVYYQVYSDGEAIHAKTSFTEDDPFIGRAVSQRVAPPHTAASIKRFLCKQENLSDYNSANLYATIFSRSALEDQSFISVETGDGPGSSIQHPVALVISEPLKQKTKKEVKVEEKKRKKEAEKVEAEERKRKKEAEIEEKKRTKDAGKVKTEERKRKKEAEAEEKKRKKEAEKVEAEERKRKKEVEIEEKKRKKEAEKVEAEERKRKKEVEIEEKKRKKETEKMEAEEQKRKQEGGRRPAEIPIQAPPNPVPELY